jgi:hypothetical protein
MEASFHMYYCLRKLILSTCIGADIASISDFHSDSSLATASVFAVIMVYASLPIGSLKGKALSPLLETALNTVSATSVASPQLAWNSGFCKYASNLLVGYSRPSYAGCRFTDETLVPAYCVLIPPGSRRRNVMFQSGSISLAMASVAPSRANLLELSESLQTAFCKY